MIAKNTWETEYDTMLEEAMYLTEDQWLLAGGDQDVFDWMDTDSDLVVTWREFLTSKVRLLVFTTRQVEGDFAVSNLQEETFGSLTADTNAIIFYDVNNDGVVNETEYVSALLDIKYYNSLLTNSATAIPNA